ncbi:MAG TPA: TonB-dependent receptor, partial [Steroidobacteraceae bacterium]|nr:TonB-dependent receptor [Steroidobacteraceae bacterium]
VLPGHPDLEGVDQYGARLSLSYNATEDLKFLLRFSISKQDPQNYAIIDGSIAPGGVGGLGYYRTTNGTATGAPLRNDQVAQDFTPRREQDTKGVALTTNWQMAPAFLLTSITSWDEGNLYIPEGTDGAPIDIFKYVEIGKDRQFIEDLRLTSTGDGPLRYIAGAFYQHDVVFSSVANRFFDSVDVNNDGVLNYQDCLASSFGPGVGYSVGSIINAGCNYQNRYDQIRNSWAAYSDVSYQLTEPVKLRLGVRYNHDNAAQKNAQALLLGSDNVPIGNIIPGSVVAGVWQPVEALPGSPNYNAIIGSTTTQYAHNSAVTGRVGVDYTPVKNILLYASYSRGYRPAAFAGQFDFSASDLSTVPAETLDAVEAGFKTDLLGRQLQLNGAVFHYQYKHQQLLDVQPNGAQPLISLGKSKIDGGELELVARPAQSFTIRGNLGLLNARIEEGYISGGTLNAAGHTLPNSPRASAMLGADWDFLKLDRTRYHLHVDGNYWSKQYFELVNEDRIAQSPYGLLNARLSLLAVDDKLEIGAWGRNLTDHFYLTNAIDFQSLGYDYRHRGIPRMFGIDAAYHF